MHLSNEGLLVIIVVGLLLDGWLASSCAGRDLGSSGI
jgi:hypothetical protein